MWQGARIRWAKVESPNDPVYIDLVYDKDGN